MLFNLLPEWEPLKTEKAPNDRMTTGNKLFMPRKTRNFHTLFPVFTSDGKGISRFPNTLAIMLFQTIQAFNRVKTFQNNFRKYSTKCYRPRSPATMFAEEYYATL